MRVQSGPETPSGSASHLDSYRRLAGEKRFEEALPHALRLIEARPGSANSYHPLLNCLLSLGLFANADLIAQSLIARDIADEHAYAALARAQFWSQQVDEAFATLDRASERYPASATLATVRQNLQAARAKTSGGAKTAGNAEPPRRGARFFGLQPAS